MIFSKYKDESKTVYQWDRQYIFGEIEREEKDHYKSISLKPLNYIFQSLQILKFLAETTEISLNNSKS